MKSLLVLIAATVALLAGLTSTAGSTPLKACAKGYARQHGKCIKIKDACTPRRLLGLSAPLDEVVP
jgi:hypothetical protein